MQENKIRISKRHIIFFIILFIFGMACNYAKDAATTKKITYSDFIKLMDEKQISKIVITSENIIITPSKNNSEYEGKTLYTANVHDENLISKLQELGIDFEGRNRKENTIFNLIFYCIIPLGSIFLVWKNVS